MPTTTHEGVHPYGFRWGPLNVTRIMMARRGNRTNYVLGVTTDHHKVEVASSAQGRSVRVWIDGVEVKV